jgi:hypothetical protein
MFERLGPLFEKEEPLVDIWRASSSVMNMTGVPQMLEKALSMPIKMSPPPTKFKNGIGYLLTQFLFVRFHCFQGFPVICRSLLIPRRRIIDWDPMDFAIKSAPIQCTLR